MKKIIATLLFLPLLLSAQVKSNFNLGTGNVYSFQIDTVIKFTIQRYNGAKNYSIFVKGQITNTSRIYDLYLGTIYSFNDTMVSGDAAQSGTSGVYLVTPHSAPVSTTKRNLFCMGTIFSYNTLTQTLMPPLTVSDPVIIINNSTGLASLTLYADGYGWFDIPPTPQSLLGTIKKIVIN